jgi:hypothetical protein
VTEGHAATERYPTQNPRAAWRVYEGEAVIVSPDDSTFHTLNPVGTLIWQAADGCTRLGAIVERICAEYAVEPEPALRDAAAFVAALCERGLMELRETPMETG